MPQRIITGLHHGTSWSEKLLILIVQPLAWVLGAATGSEEFTWIAGGIASLTTALFILVKTYLLVKGYEAKDALEQIIDVEEALAKRRANRKKK